MRKIIAIVLMSCVSVFAQQRAVLVSTAAAVDSEISRSADYVGTVSYRSVVPVAAERAGRIDSAVSEEGRTVKKGEVLASINTDTLKHSIISAKARVNQQKELLDKSSRDFERAEIMYRQQTVSEQVYQNASTDLAIQKQLYEIAATELALLEEELNKSIVRAPFEGIVLKRYVNVGQWVSLGGAVYDIAAKELEVVVNVPQSAVNFVVSGAGVPVKINNEYYRGTVRTVIPQGNATLRTFPVMIAIPYSDRVFGGMDCVASLPVSDTIRAVVVPRDAVVTRNNATMVFVVEGGKAKLIPAKVLGYTGVGVGIETAGITSGTAVITRGNELLADGQAVTVNQ